MIELIVILVSGVIMILAMKGLIKTLFNLQALRHEKKHPGSLPCTGGGIVYNSKTQKLEETSERPILPFD